MTPKSAKEEAQDIILVFKYKAKAGLLDKKVQVDDIAKALEAARKKGREEWLTSKEVDSWFNAGLKRAAEIANCSALAELCNGSNHREVIAHSQAGKFIAKVIRAEIKGESK